MKKHVFHRGVTLVETLIVVALFILISGFMVSMSIQYGQLYALGESQFLTVGNVRTSLDSMSVYIPQAHRIVPSHIIDSTTYTTGTSTVILQLPAINQNGDVISNAWDYVVFYATGNNMYRLISSDAASSRASGSRILGNTITSVAFTYNNASTTLATRVSVDMQTSNTKNHVTATNHETTDFILRNY